MTRCTTTLRPSSAVRRVGPTCALAAAMLAASPAGAQAETVARRAQQTYQCVASNGEAIRNEPLGLGMTLNVPTSVAPGASLSLRGTVDVRVPDEYSAGAAQFDVKWVDAISDTMNAKVTVGDRTFLHPADRWSTGRQPARVPLVPSGPVTFPTIRIPADARGAVTIRLPGNGFTRNPLSGTPATVAYVARATVHWTVTWSFAWACSVQSGEPNVIATIPIVAPGAPTPTAPATSGGGGTQRPRPSAPSRDRTDSPTGTTTSTTPPATAPGSDNPFGSSAAGASGGGAGATDASDATETSGVSTGEAAGQQTPDGAIAPTGGGAAPVLAQQATAQDGVRLPATWLWIAGLGGAGLLAGWAAHLRRRVQVLERDD
jgi:hypothetical protein